MTKGDDSSFKILSNISNLRIRILHRLFRKQRSFVFKMTVSSATISKTKDLKLQISDDRSSASRKFDDELEGYLVPDLCNKISNSKKERTYLIETPKSKRKLTARQINWRQLSSETD